MFPNTDNEIGSGAELGALTVGTDATPTGTDASSIAVLDFTGAATTLFGDGVSATPVTVVHSQTLGSTFKPNRRGLWHVELDIVCTGAGTIQPGINVDGIAADLNSNPQVSARTRAAGNHTGAAGDVQSINLSAIVKITDNMARDTTGASGGIIRALATNGAGAAPAAANLVAAQCSIRLTRICDLPPGA